MKTKYLKIFTLSLVALFVTAGEIKAQSELSVDVGADVMSRYVWRGFQFGAGPSVQPSISFATGDLEFGFWGAFDTSGDPAGTEVDIYAAYSIGDFSLAVTDYTFPTGGGYYSEPDMHFVEAGIGYGGSDEFPVSISASMFLINDDDNSVYIELGVPAGPVDLFIGGTPSESGMYSTTGAGIINVGMSTGRTVEVTDTFSFDVSGALITNPYAETLNLLFGISL